MYYKNSHTKCTNILTRSNSTIIYLLLTYVLGQSIVNCLFWLTATTKGGCYSKKSVDWSDTDAILPGESIGKEILSLQIPEVWNDEVIQVLLRKKFELSKRLYRFKPQTFKRWSDISTFTQKKFESTKRLYPFKPQNLLAMKQYNYLYNYFYLNQLCECHISVGEMRGFTDFILP
jgi:hypothetical protein